MNNIFEIIGCLCAVIGVILTARQDKLCWVFGIVGSICLVISFAQAHIYGQIGVQAISIAQCVIGWHQWSKNDDLKPSDISPINTIQYMLGFIAIGIAFTILTTKTPTLYNYADGIGAFIAILATVLIIKKVLSSWWLFMINNAIVMVLCLNIGLYWIFALNLLLFIISIKGYIEWKKDLKMA
jgi:nicotinamide mononucleotide transporter